MDNLIVRKINDYNHGGTSCTEVEVDFNWDIDISYEENIMNFKDCMDTLCKDTNLLSCIKDPVLYFTFNGSDSLVNKIPYIDEVNNCGQFEERVTYAYLDEQNINQCELEFVVNVSPITKINSYTLKELAIYTKQIVNNNFLLNHVIQEIPAESYDN